MSAVFFFFVVLFFLLLLLSPSSAFFFFFFSLLFAVPCFLFFLCCCLFIYFRNIKGSFEEEGIKYNRIKKNSAHFFYFYIDYSNTKVLNSIIFIIVKYSSLINSLSKRKRFSNNKKRTCLLLLCIFIHSD